ncbi:hypothetical protein [Labilibaculum euxinus]
MEYISIILNGIFGGGLLISLFTLRSTKNKAVSEAKAKELDNVQEAITIWREMAEGLKAELVASRDNYKEITEQVKSLKRAVSRLTLVNNKMVKLLDKITPENLDEMVKQIKEIHDES